MTSKLSWVMFFLLIAGRTLYAQALTYVVDFSAERGFYNDAFNLSLASDLPNASIRYSLDASDPMLGTGIPYNLAIPISGTAFVRAIAYNATDTTRISTHSYIFQEDIIHSGDLDLTYVNDPTLGPLLRDALSSLPTLSIVRPDADNITYDESETSLEWIPAGKHEGFQIDCGVHRFGGYFTNFAKRSFRLHFRSEYGEGKLDYPVFAHNDSIPVDVSFDQLDLRMGSHDMVLRGFYMSNGFTDQTMADMGHISPHGRYVHLYINGRYWGQYYLRERFGADFLATYQGGSDTLYEAINGNKNVGGWSPGTVYDGDGSQWAYINTLQSYDSLSEVVDISNYIDYILLYMYGRCENEYRTGGSDVLGAKFIFHLNDADGWTRSGNNYNLRDGPAQIWTTLVQDDDPKFRALLADRIHKHFYQNGALSATANSTRLDKLSQQVALSMISECARWGYRTYDSWLSDKDAFISTFNGKSTDVLNHLIQEGYYHNVEAVSYSQDGGQISAGFQLSLSHPEPNTDIYYTQDGSEPIDSEGNIQPQANLYTAPFTINGPITDVKARAYLITPFNDLAQGKFAEQSSTGFGGLASRAVDGNTNGQWGNGSVAHTNKTAQPWWQVDLGSPANITDIHLYNRTDCCSARMSDYYILVSPNPFISDDLNTVLNQAGVQGFYQSGTAASPTIIQANMVGQYVRVQLQGTEYINFAELEVFGSFQNGQLPGNAAISPNCPVRFYQSQDFSGLAINELNYHPADTCGAEFIEFKNTGSSSLDLTDCFFKAGLAYTFPKGAIIAPDSFWVLARNPAEFENAYGFAPDGRYLDKLDNGEERLILSDPFGGLIDSVHYNDNMPWDSLADGYGPSLELINASADNTKPEYWAANPSSCGSPKAENSILCGTLAPAVVINEINYNEADALASLQTGDWVELYNPNSFVVDMSAWQWQDEDTTYIFPPGTLIPASSFLILTEDSSAFKAVHPQASHFVELTHMGLNKQGERLLLRSDNVCPVDHVDYNDKNPWPTAADGDGYSLMLSDPLLNNDQGVHWIASTNLAGTPAQPNADLCANTTDSILINEINYRSNSGADAGDWIELYNLSSNAIDLSAWELHDGGNFYTFPPGTIISGNGFLVIAQDLFKFYSIFPSVPGAIGGWSFGLSGDGEQLSLLTSNRCLVDQLSYNDSPPWPTEPDGQGPSLALIDPTLNNADPGSWAGSNWGNAPLGTPAAANNLPTPCSGTELPILINEILYNSDPLQDSGNWLELYNPNAQAVDLSGWHLMDEDSVFTIPSGTQIAAESYLIIAEDLALFQSIYPSVSSLVLGSSLLNFNNQGERLLLYTDSRCLIDLVEYDDKNPWPASDLRDPIIALLDHSFDNNIGTSWHASEEMGTPGSENIWSSQPGLGQQDLHLWLKGDLDQSDSSSVSLWPDHSPQANDATQSIAGDEPYYVEEVLNGHGVLRFDGTQDWLKVNGLANVLSGQAAVFAVFIPKLDNDDGYYLSTHLGGTNKIKLGHKSSGELIYDDDDPYLKPNSYLDLPTISSVNFYPDIIAKAWVNGGVATALTDLAASNADRVSIGQEFDGSGNDNETSNHWKGDLAELIVFKGTLDSESQSAVESYLNIKYGINIPVASHRFYDHINYSNGIAGLGKDVLQALNQTNSQSADSTSVLRISNPNDLQHGEYLVWGHDDGSTLEADASLNVPAGVEKRLGRIWRVQETGELGTVKLDFELSDPAWASIDPRAWAILIDTDLDFTDAQIHPLSDPIDLVNGQYFTLAKRQYVRISAKVLLSGAYDNGTQLMRDDLSQNDLLPYLDPYTQTTVYDPNIFIGNPADAIVDWVWVALRDKNDPSQILHQAPMLLQRDGDIVDTENNSSFLLFLSDQGPIPASQEFYISIQHRNHLGVMSATTLAFGEAVSHIDFTQQTGYGQNAQKSLTPTTYGLWAGDSNGDGQLIFQGANNDPGRIFIDVLSAPNNSAFSRNYILHGYHDSDTNLDGEVIFQGAASDINLLFINVLSHPQNTGFSRNFLIIQQIP